MSRQTPFQDKPVQRSVGDVITTMQCLFCVHIGREKHEGPVWNTNAPRTRSCSSSRFDPRPTKIITNLNITKTGPVINCSRIKKRLHSSRKMRSLAFIVSWTRTRIACNSPFRGLRSSMMWWEIYFSIRRKTKKTMRPNWSRRPTPWSCSNRRRTDHTWWRSRILCDSTSQFGTFLLGCRFDRHPRWLSNIIQRPRMPNSAASTTTWSVS